LKPFRVFVTATDTGVGKTQVASALLSLLADAGLNPAPFKPYESGCVDLRRPPDAWALRQAARAPDSIDRICPHRFRAPLAPGVAAHREGREPPFARTLSAFRSFEGRPLVVEGAGGLFVPLDSKREVIDLIAQLRLPVVLVARAGLGTLNHTALSLGALAARNVDVLAVVLSKSDRKRDRSEEDNADQIAARHGVRVLGPVPYVGSPARRREAFRRVLKPLTRTGGLMA
jgi:dethiobiotin synthetase